MGKERSMGVNYHAPKGNGFLPATIYKENQNCTDAIAPREVMKIKNAVLLMPESKKACLVKPYFYTSHPLHKVAESKKKQEKH